MRGVELEKKIICVGTIAFCFITLFCRIVLMTIGNGYLTQSKVFQYLTQSKVSRSSTTFITWLQLKKNYVLHL